MDIRERFLKTISDYGLLKRGDSVLVALSGGPDSVALLYLLYGIKDDSRLELAAAHLDHRMIPGWSWPRRIWITASGRIHRRTESFARNYAGD
jgi:tRNA(Ile)-lysidine synthase TilS/MesJ